MQVKFMLFHISYVCLYLTETHLYEDSHFVDVLLTKFFCRYYKIVEGDHILFIVNRERAGVQFDVIYDSIFERCRKHAFRRTPTLPNHVQH